MIETILFLFLVFFAVIGISSLFSKVYLSAMSPENIAGNIAIIFLDENCIEAQIIYYYEKYRWYGKEFAHKILFVYDGDFPRVAYRISGIYSDAIFLLNRCQLADYLKEW